MKLFEDGDPFFAPMLNALFAAFRGTAVMSGCEVSATGTSRTVSITAGSVQINGEVIAVEAGSVTLDAGSTFDRYDLVSVNASGSKIVTKGTTKRKCPTQPANTCLLAIVFMPAGATVIATGNVYDARMLSQNLAAAAIECAGAIDMPARNIGVGSGFVDVPGSVLRKTISFTKVLEVGGDWVHLLTFSVPNDYANDIDSNCRILLSRTTANYGSQNITVEAYVGDKLIGTGSGAYNSGTITMNTTGGFRAGDTISLRGKCHTGSPHYPGTHTVSNCRILSARHTSIPLVARYVEKTW